MRSSRETPLCWYFLATETTSRRFPSTRRFFSWLAWLSKEIGKLEARLQKKDFVERAPQAVIEETRGNLLGLREKKAKLEASLALLK